MPAPRLLLLADPKLLPALAAGLGEGNRFEVTAVPLADAAAAQAAAEGVNAAALFYGTAGTPLPAAIQALSAKIRPRGGRVIAVLQRDQAALRDDCFRAGASDILFMPIPKDPFVARLAASVALAFPAEAGARAAVNVATRAASLRLESATVSPVGVESASPLAVKPGDTVRLSWGTFQSWGLVVRGTPSVQIRFAGLVQEEEGKIREWAAAQPAQPASSARPAPVPQAPAAPAPAVPAGARAAPASGPPPGFGDRKPPARPMQRPAGAPQASGAAAAAPVVAPAAAPAAGSAPAAPAPRSPAQAARPVVQPAANRAAPRASNGSSALSSELFDTETPPVQAAAPVTQKQAPAGPPWPTPVDAARCKESAMQLLAGATLDRGVPGPIASSAKKITALLSVGERAWIERIGPESHFADALAARIALDAATAEGTRMGSANIVPTVDASSLAALTKVADEAAGRLQKEANAAIGQGEVENLQLITAASAALSRDLLNLKETADRLRGIGAAPRLGAGALDPDVVLAAQQPRPKPVQAAAPVVKSELRDFRGLEEKPGKAKGILAAVLIIACAGVAANAFYFSSPRVTEIPGSAVGEGVRRIQVTGTSAVVTVTPEWLADPQPNIAKLVKVLNANKVRKAVLLLPNGVSGGIVDVAAGRTSGVPAQAAR